MTLPLSFYLVTAAAVFVTGLSKSGFGGGLGVVSVPMLSLFVEPQFAVAVLMPLLITMDVIVVWQYRHHWRKDVVKAMLPGALVGLAIGLATFQWMNAELIRFVVGLLALAFVAQYLLSRTSPAIERAPRHGAAFALAALSGFASYVAHAGGPPVKGYLLAQRLDKSVFVGTNTMYFFSMNALKTVSYTLMGQLSFDSLAVSLWIAPVLLGGIAVGNFLHKRIDQRLFIALVYGFLALAGAKLLSDSITSLLV
ncbi:sulfite exporter TauE/SafE family protein [Roseibium sp. MMSF_3544]|uniref:sulfite exporter TauE/SafE family protein n=1 Tax=unclassified Roseibium TaxID=2629323 RepID=UPI00273F7E7A|nr:sulfite exporter TauE/SafE family protein [Roseibium sp. MMSF_3544]